MSTLLVTAFTLNCCPKFESIFERSTLSTTRGHSVKLVKHRCKLDLWSDWPSWPHQLDVHWISAPGVATPGKWPGKWRVSELVCQRDVCLPWAWPPISAHLCYWPCTGCRSICLPWAWPPISAHLCYWPCTGCRSICRSKVHQPWAAMQSFQLHEHQVLHKLAANHQTKTPYLQQKTIPCSDLRQLLPLFSYTIAHRASQK